MSYVQQCLLKAMGEMLDFQKGQIIGDHLVGVSVTLTVQLFGVLRTALFMYTVYIFTVYTKHRKIINEVGENQKWMKGTVEH